MAMRSERSAPREQPTALPTAGLPTIALHTITLPTIALPCAAQALGADLMTLHAVK